MKLLKLVGSRTWTSPIAGRTTVKRDEVVRFSDAQAGSLQSAGSNSQYGGRWQEVFSVTPQHDFSLVGSGRFEEVLTLDQVENTDDAAIPSPGKATVLVNSGGSLVVRMPSGELVSQGGTGGEGGEGGTPTYPASFALAVTDEVTPFQDNTGVALVTAHLPFTMLATSIRMGLSKVSNDSPFTGARLDVGLPGQLLAAFTVYMPPGIETAVSTAIGPVLIPAGTRLSAYILNVGGDGLARGMKLYLEGTRDA